MLYFCHHSHPTSSRVNLKPNSEYMSAGLSILPSPSTSTSTCTQMTTLATYCLPCLNSSILFSGHQCDRMKPQVRLFLSKELPRLPIYSKTTNTQTHLMSLQLPKALSGSWLFLPPTVCPCELSCRRNIPLFSVLQSLCS